MNITLSQDKVSETVEVLIHHMNCVTGKLRSLVLVEDLFDTIKVCLSFISDVDFIIIFVYFSCTFNILYLKTACHFGLGIDICWILVQWSDSYNSGYVK